MLLLVGLGNPGPKYERNRHNIGFLVVDEIIRRHSFATWRGRFQALTAEGHFGGERVMAMKPTTFMNESGRAVGEAARFFKLAPEDVVVLHDELDLVFGKVRIKRGGGHAGHNGLRSIDAHLGKSYARIRLGIGHPGDKTLVPSHVLSDFTKAEAVDLSILIDAISDAAPMLANPDQHNAFMTKVALASKPPTEKKPSKGAQE
jgi:PTH1 family peptidyl-tRNA hydrolase